MIERLCVIGVGLIGGSLARALRANGSVGEVVGCGRSRRNLERAVELGVVDRFDHDPAKAVAGADMVLLAVPLGSMQDVFTALAPGLRADAVLTDAGSAKRSVIDAARLAFGRVPPRFVPGHPIAGTERSGVEASFAELYQRRRTILTPLPDTDADAVTRVRAMWESAGSEVSEMDPAHHDEVLAATSHLPHLLAYTLVDVLGGMEERVEIFRYAGAGFRDFTRIASSDPQMWHDICLANNDALVDVLERFTDELLECTEAVRAGDGKRIRDLFVRAKARRDRYIQESGA